MVAALVFFLFRYFVFNPSVSSKRNILFKIPAKLFPEKYNKKFAFKKIDLTVKKRKIASDYFFRSCHSMDKNNFSSAKSYISMAIAQNPNEKKFYKVLSLIEVEIDNRKKMENINKMVNSSRLDESWKYFNVTCKNNYSFFSRYARKYAYILKENKELASASSILLAIKYRDRKRGNKN
jgi:hypothetical protein